MHSKDFRLWPFLLLLLGMAVVLGTWWLFRPVSPKAPPMEQVFQLNNKGVGLMEQFQYEKAAKVFAEVVQKAPNWIPGKINLGIAYFNQNTPELLTRALKLYEEILKKNPDNLHAHYCAGIILHQQSNLEEASDHFRFVTQKDPADPDAWYFLGETLGRAKEARDCFVRALELNPYHGGALYSLAMELRLHDEKKSKELFNKHKELSEQNQLHVTKVAYTKMGKYSEVIGQDLVSSSKIQNVPLPLFSRSEHFQVKLAKGARWATSADFGTDTIGKLRREVRKRFGGVIVVLDFDRDGKQDLFLLGAVVESGKVRDLLLHNEGSGIFRDVTSEMGLEESWSTLGCSVGDFNNDGYPDLLITGAGQQRLYANVEGKSGKRRFQDVSREASLDAVKTVCLGAMWMDLDQDSDLDLLLCQYAATPEEALMALKNGAASGPGLAVFLNVGEAPPIKGTDTVPLKTAFRPVDQKSGLIQGGLPAVCLAASDLDRDNDLDLLLLADQKQPIFLLNDRLLKFHSVTLPEDIVTSGKWNGGLVFNSTHQDRSDLFLLRPKEKPLLLVNQATGSEKNRKNWFRLGTTNSPPLIAAQAVDVDLDSWTDIVGLAENGQPVLLRNDGTRLVHVLHAFGSEKDFAKDVIAVQMLEANGDCFPDLLVWSENEGLHLRHNHGNGNRGLNLQVTGRRDKGGDGEKDLRTNADGFGTWVAAQAGSLWTGVEYTTLSAGLGQSRLPLLLGIGKYSSADVVRLHWPDNIRQAELEVPACKPYLITQTNRVTDSCPLLFTWDGQKFVFINDILGAGAMGEASAGGGYRPPRPEESIKIEAHQLAPKHGKFELKIAETRDEIAYLDQFHLLVVDYPKNLVVYPDERFTGTAAGPSQDLLVFDEKQQIFPLRVLDHRGKEVTSKLQKWDRDTVDQFAVRSWLGFAEDHWIELEFGDELKHFGPKDKLFLCLAGWTAYPYPESIWAAEQAGVELQPPSLQRWNKSGKWETVIADLGFPAGLPRMITMEITGLATGPKCKLRIPTNMQIYWDQIFVAPLLERVSSKSNASFVAKQIKVHALSVNEAQLQSRSFLKEFSPDGRKPSLYEYEQTTKVPVPKFSGHLTKTGLVSKLLQHQDDLFVVMGPGDELTMNFDGSKIPPLLAGWTRSFVLQSCGYSRSFGLFIAEGGKVLPLPFRGMKNFPYAPRQSYPLTPLHQSYQQQFNNRQVGNSEP